MSRNALLIVSMAALFTFGCAPSSSIYHAVNPWSTVFETAVDRCSAIREASGTRARAGCERMMNRLIAMENAHEKSFCYTVDRRKICKKRPQAAYSAASAFYTGADKQTYGR